jgi:hypothetical protein
MGCIQLAHDRGKLAAVLKMVMNILFYKRLGIYLLNKTVPGS